MIRSLESSAWKSHRRSQGRLRFAAAAVVLALVVGGIFGIRALDSTPDRPVEPVLGGDRWIVYRSGSELIAVDPDHPTDAASVGAAHRLDPIASSRNGSALLLGFARRTEDLYVLNADGSRIRLTSDGSSYSGSFSPTGTGSSTHRSGLRLVVSAAVYT